MSRMFSTFTGSRGGLRDDAGPGPWLEGLSFRSKADMADASDGLLLGEIDLLPFLGCEGSLLVR